MKNLRKARYYFLALALASLFSSCKKDKDDNPPPATTGNLTVSISYKADALPLQFNTIQYTNAAGNNYGVTLLEYYLSQLYLIKTDSSKLLIKDYQYCNAAEAATGNFTMGDIPLGDYIGIAFNIGLDSLHNISNILPATTENVNMIWPPPMGGGYHFMKFEGHFTDAVDTNGFAMHLGTNACLIHHRNIYAPVTINNNTSFSLTMNLNEWFRNPEVYDFNIDGNYSMGVTAAMMKLSGNGVDVFTH